MMIPLTCPDVTALKQLVLGELPAEEISNLQEHLSHCADCLATVGDLPTDDPLLRAVQAQSTEPELEDEVVERLIERLRVLGPTLVGLAADPPVDGTPESYDFLGPPAAPGELGRLGPYRILRVLGSGGMGIVFEAEDPQLERKVALKVMKPNLVVQADARQRFLREARASAAIQHDHIVTIHQVGEDRGIPYIAMQLLHGETLEHRLQRERRLPAAEVARIGREIGEGLAAAHAHGLIHRDIKPANVWLERLPEVAAESGGADRVKIVDFGLARAAREPTHTTQTGIVAGTPAYMAPEQASDGPIDHRCDLFSLGCVLYRCSTGELPFKGVKPLRILWALAVKQPAPPRQLNPEMPAALSSLIQHLLAKEPDDRPQSTREVAQALHDIERRLAGATDPFARPRRRGNLLAAGLLVIFLGVLGFAYSPTVYRLVTDQGQLVIETDDPNVQVIVMQKEQQVTIIDAKTKQEVTLKAGKYQIELAGPPAGLKLTASEFTLERGGKEIVRVRVETGVTTAEIRQFEHDGAYAVVFSRDSRRILSGGWDHAVRLWDVESGNRLHVFNLRESGKNHAVYCVAISRDGRRGLAGSRDGRVWLLDLEQGKVLHHCDHARTPEKSGFGVNSVAFAPDGRQALLGSYDGVVRVWDVEEWKELSRIQHSFGLWSVDYSPDGRRALIAGGKSGEAHLSWWDLESLKELYRGDGLEAGLWRALYSPDGRFAASASHDKTLRLWDATTGKEVRSHLHPDGVHSVCFSSDGRWLISGGYDGAVRIWDAKSGREVHRYVGPKGGSTSVAVSPNGRHIASAGDKTVRLWKSPP